MAAFCAPAARNLLPISSTGWFVIVEGVIRVSIFVAYLALISLLPDLRRVFQYHAAEHKAINAFEAGADLEPETVQKYSLIHVRCGTAFLLWVMVVAIVVFGASGQKSNEGSSGMSGGLGGDCLAAVGCQANADCSSNLCDTTAHVCECARNADCATGTCNTTTHACQ